SVTRPYMIPVRILMPWKAPSRMGTIAADTSYYPFGTRMYIPGYGWGVVGDRGGAIKGPDRLDIFINSTRRANDWGRRNVTVTIDR
ncbi:MAG: 3D domain-containing protein, partial [Candidatus Sumerlaeaceae bacterium]|nr:3D domain-containing protein [Candidatus Sumerlaeaceae bacterium]